MNAPLLDLDTRVELLRRTMFFRDSDEGLLRKLAAGCVEVQLEPWDVLCRAGDPGDALYIIANGLMEIYIDQTPLDEAGSGECLGEMALVTDKPRSASIRAIHPSLILSLARMQFSETLLSHPELAWGVFRELAAKVRASIKIRVKQHKLNVKLEEAFARSVSRGVMEEILRTGDPEELLEGSTKRATVLFADIRAFTSLSERLAPAEVIHLLNEYLSSMVDVILDTDGTLDKFMGDGILAHFGVPLPRPEDPINALRCAVGMHQRLAQLGETGTWVPRYPIKIGVGLATGEVVAGCIGSERRMDYTVIGDVVNTASRVESLTKAYGTPVLLDQATSQEVEGEFQLRMVDRVRVKGKRYSTDLFDVNTGFYTAKEWDVLIEDHREALRPYEDGDFAAARDAFTEILHKHPDDGPAKTLQIRCARFALRAPANWDGVYALDHK